jgi:UPF0716 protein FxsA
MPFLILLGLFVLVPIAEISVLISVGSSIGAVNTILFVIFTAILGAYLVRQQGFATLQAYQAKVQSGQIPAGEIAEGIALLFAGAVLLTPGFITDALGFCLLIPPMRRAIIGFMSRSIISRGSARANFYYQSGDHQGGDSQGYSQKSGTVIEGEYIDKDR